MADQKVSNLPALNGADVDSADLLYIVDSSAGTAGSKKITIGQYQLAPYSAATANTVVYFNGTKVPTSSSALTFDGTNLGVGTSSPATKLHVNTGAAGYGITVAASTQTSITYQLGIDSNSNLAVYDTNAAAQRLVLSTSGNLGLGVTPSAWSVIKAIQIGSSAGSSIYADNGSTIVGVASNAYYSSTGWRYFGTALASRYEQAIGAHAWYTAPSGTAGNAISFTQAMTLDASGVLSVGTPLAENATGVYALPAGELRVKDNTEDGTSQISIYNNNTTNDLEQFFVAMSAADVNIGNRRTDGGALKFFTFNTERARITSGGEFLVGRTSAVASEFLSVEGSNTNFLSRFRNTSATTPAGMFVSYTAAAPNGTGSLFLRCDDNAATRAEIRSNGGLANYQANDVNLSDRREKTNFAPAKDYLDTICAIPVQTFNYIDQSEDDPGLTLGVVAQDVQAVAPELVQESNWGTEDNPKVRLSIYQTDLQYALMKCIQEQQAIITDLRARVAALEAK